MSAKLLRRRFLHAPVVRCSIAAIATALAGSAVAAAAAPFAAPASGAVTSTAEVLRLVFGLAFVLVLVKASAWLMRRLRGIQSANALGLEVVSQVSLGARERAVLVRIRDRHVLLGIGPGNVRTLLVLDAPPATSAAGEPSPGIPAEPQASVMRPSFKALLSGGFLK